MNELPKTGETVRRGSPLRNRLLSIAGASLLLLAKDPVLLSDSTNTRPDSSDLTAKFTCYKSEAGQWSTRLSIKTPEPAEIIVALGTGSTRIIRAQTPIEISNAEEPEGFAFASLYAGKDISQVGKAEPLGVFARESCLVENNEPRLDI